MSLEMLADCHSPKVKKVIDQKAKSVNNIRPLGHIVYISLRILILREIPIILFIIMLLTDGPCAEL